MAWTRLPVRASACADSADRRLQGGAWPRGRKGVLHNRGTLRARLKPSSRWKRRPAQACGRFASSRRGKVHYLDALARRRVFVSGYMTASILSMASMSKYRSPQLAQTSASTSRTVLPLRSSTSTTRRSTRRSPHAMHVRNVPRLVVVGGDFRRDEDVEDFAFLLADNRTFRVGERSGVSEAFDGIGADSANRQSKHRAG